MLLTSSITFEIQNYPKEKRLWIYMITNTVDIAYFLPFHFIGMNIIHQLVDCQT